ncbi:hypothetical protein KSB_67740 [Ktedonobacter robiniae]|uniref:Uncharacterized protein n=1 Tax=Ktedonobacter robiniae TaxID=2778365 RepID=A0ABQ3V073_9CHLR|nr:hypothetical protein KSB_67740 [Ktedonobacter robiniae]
MGGMKSNDKQSHGLTGWFSSGAKRTYNLYELSYFTGNPPQFVSCRRSRGRSNSPKWTPFYAYKMSRCIFLKSIKEMR